MYILALIILLSTTRICICNAFRESSWIFICWLWTPDGWQRHVFKELWSKSCTGHNEGITDPWAGAHSVDSFPGLDCSAASSAHTPAGTWWDSWALSKILTKKIIYLGAKLIGPNGHLYGHSLTRGTNQAKQISIFQKRKKKKKQIKFCYRLHITHKGRC